MIELSAAPSTTQSKPPAILSLIGETPQAQRAPAGQIALRFPGTLCADDREFTLIDLSGNVVRFGSAAE